jgi:hypothetical protein
MQQLRQHGRQAKGCCCGGFGEEVQRQQATQETCGGGCVQRLRGVIHHGGLHFTAEKWLKNDGIRRPLKQAAVQQLQLQLRALQPVVLQNQTGIGQEYQNFVFR